MSTGTKLTLAGVVGAFLVGLAVGRGLLPANRTEKETVLDRGTTVINQQVDIDSILKRIEDVMKKSDVKKVKDVIKHPDGSVQVHEEETDLTETTKHSQSEADSHTATTVKLIDDKLHVDEKIRQVTYSGRSNWAFVFEAGYVLPTVFGRDLGFNLIPYKNGFVAFAVERRLFGPVSAGLFANSLGAAGLQLRLSY